MLDFFSYTHEHLFLFSLIFIRLCGITLSAPIFGGESLPKQMQVILALSFTFVVFPVLATTTLALPASGIEYLLVVIKELYVGLLIGFLVHAVFFGFQLGGRYMSIHMGLSMAQIFDPFSNQKSSAIGQFLGLFTLTVFLVVNGHHFILRAVYDSFTLVPPLQVTFSPDIFDYAINIFNIVIRVSLKVALPTMAALFTINLVFGFSSRLVPQMNVFVVSLPAKIGAGVIIVTTILPAIVLVLFNTMEKVFSDIYVVMKALT